MSMAQLGTYDHAKSTYREWLGLNDGVPLHLVSSVTSGVVACTISLPIDLTKTRMQNQTVLPDGQLQYRSIHQTAKTIVAQDGVLALWKGFLPYLARGGGHTVMMFLFVEQYRALVTRWYT